MTYFAVFDSSATRLNPGYCHSLVKSFMAFSSLPDMNFWIKDRRMYDYCCHRVTRKFFLSYSHTYPYSHDFPGSARYTLYYRDGVLDVPCKYFY